MMNHTIKFCIYKRLEGKCKNLVLPCGDLWHLVIFYWVFTRAAPITIIFIFNYFLYLSFRV